MEFLNKIKIAVLLFLVPLALGGYYVAPLIKPTYDNIKKERELRIEVDGAKMELEQIKATLARQNETPDTVNEKIIYQSQGLQLSSDASFASLFEDTIETAKNSGIRIRSIEYIYQPKADPIVASGLEGYNSCELNIVAVGTYTEFQNFYKNILREHYLTYFAEIEVKPWEQDKAILINNIKLRLYTKT